MVTDYLAERGKRVTVLNRHHHYAEEMSSNDRFYLRERLKRETVTLFKSVRVKQILDHGVRVTMAGDFRDLSGYDALVLAEAMTPIREVVQAVKRRGLPLILVGDAKQPRTIMHAIAEGEEAGRDL
jgi:hypothetical protein